MRTVAMSKSDIDDLELRHSDCFELIDDLILKLWFRRRFLGRRRKAPAHSYAQAVHGWQDLPFDVERLRIDPAKRSHGRLALQSRTPAQPSFRGDAGGAGSRYLFPLLAPSVRSSRRARKRQRLRSQRHLGLQHERDQLSLRSLDPRLPDLGPPAEVDEGAATDQRRAGRRARDEVCFCSRASSAPFASSGRLAKAAAPPSVSAKPTIAPPWAKVRPSADKDPGARPSALRPRRTRGSKTQSRAARRTAADWR